MKNGTLGTVEKAATDSLAVRLDDGRRVSVDLKSYAHVDHGYAATVHKTQGMTVDRTHVLATPGLDAHATYVAMSRHRDGAAVHYGRDDFADERQLRRTLARERPKDMALDYEPRSSASPPARAQSNTSVSPSNDSSPSPERSRGLAAVVRRALGLSGPDRSTVAGPDREAGTLQRAAVHGERSAEVSADAGKASATTAASRGAADASQKSATTRAATGSAATSDRANDLRAMVAARVNAPRPTPESMREALAAAAKAAPELDRDQDYGAGL